MAQDKTFRTWYEEMKMNYTYMFELTTEALHKTLTLSFKDSTISAIWQ